MPASHEIHVPFLSQDERLFLNTTAAYSQSRRSSNASDISRLSTEVSINVQKQRNYSNRRQQSISVPSLSFLWKRRDSSSSYLSSSSDGSAEYSGSMSIMEEDSTSRQEQLSGPQSPKAKELESLIFEQPQRTVRLSLTPVYAS